MKKNKTTFALFLGNRGFFPSSLIEGARRQMTERLNQLGHEVLISPVKATRHGAVETVREGQVYANFLEQHRGEIDGIILSLPNFGDETGAVAALQNAGAPIFIHAFPDEIDKMSPEKRRDSFCGKISIMDVFHQYGIPFTVQKPHVVDSASPRFESNIDYFDRLCRTVKAVKGMVVGSIGARTTPFKTVRIDEITLQRHGITVETLDMSEIMARIKTCSNGPAAKEKAAVLKGIADWQAVPDAAFQNLVKLGVVLDEVIEEYQMDALAIRCWLELQSQMGISPCVLLSELNQRGIAAACEVDVGSAVTMHALGSASDGPSTCLDWNNNYGEDDERCILFHCGPVPPDLMAGTGRISDHAILSNSTGPGCGFGCNVGRITSTLFTFGNVVTESGELNFYLGRGEITDDPIPEEFFGCAGVARIEGLQDVLLHIGREGHRHHVSMVPGDVMEPVREALDRYLGCRVGTPQK